jgi:NADH/NAD ratio-sensing transcriptional regulator Rex
MRSDFWENIRFICSALGGGGGNTLEGFQFTYAQGCRMFEVDVSLTDDGYAVCTHLPNAITGKDNPGLPGIVGCSVLGLKYNEFMSLKPGGKFTVLDINNLIELLRDHPDAYFVIDAKYIDKKNIRNIYTQLLNGFQETLTGDKSLINHFIPEVASIDAYNAVMEVYKFDQVIYNPHRYTIKVDALVRFLDSVDNVHAITTYPGSGKSNDFGLVLQKCGYYCILAGSGNMEGHERHLDYGMHATYGYDYVPFGIQFQTAEKISKLYNIALFISFQLDIDFDILRSDLENGYDIVILGVGKNGRALFDLLKKVNIPVKYFCDIKSVFTGEIIDDIPVLTPEELKNIPGKFSYLFGTDYFQLILDKIIALDMLIGHKYNKIGQLEHGAIYRSSLLSIFNEWGKIEQFQKSKTDCVVFGAGGVGKTAIKVFEQLGIKISFIVDNNTGMWGKRVRGIEVKSPNALNDNKKPVIIASRFFHEIYKQLMNMDYFNKTIEA